MSTDSPHSRTTDANTFEEDVAFLQRHVPTVVLEQEGAKVAVVPAYQGRVMTSTTDGDADLSFGWLNYPVIERGVLSPAEAAGELQAHIHVFGGEERFWLGPEGGQFGIYFPPGAPFDFDSWKTPAPIDTEPFFVEAQSSDRIELQRRFTVQNHSGQVFDVGIRRVIRLLSRAELANQLGLDMGPNLNVVAYETANEMVNLGDTAWTQETGALSIWLLGMYRHSPATTVVIPVQNGQGGELGPAVNDAYFGAVPEDRLRVEGDVIYFRADGAYRSKIGVSPAQSRGVAGSYAADSRTLNLVLYDRPQTHAGYVNSMWERQSDPYSGDALNAYNDGAPEPGADPLGPFYELESSSPAGFLKPGESLLHVQRTVHLRGDEAALERVAREQLGVGLQAIEAAF